MSNMAQPNDFDDVLKRCIAMLDKERVFKASKVSPFFESTTVLSAIPGEVVIKFHVEKIHLNSNGFMHGGVLSVLVDFFTFIAAETIISADYSTSLELNVKYLKALREGETYIARLEAVTAGKRFVVCKGDFRNMNGEVVAKGSQTIYRISPGKFENGNDMKSNYTENEPLVSKL